MKATVRRIEDIQVAHDILEVVTHTPGLLARLYRPDQHELLIAALNVLCWVLKHPNSHQFDQNLADIIDGADRAGYDLVELMRAADAAPPGPAKPTDPPA